MNATDFQAATCDAAAPERGEGRPGAASRLLILLVRVYQAARAGRRSPCRYDPSCSAYAVTALERFGAVRGTWLAARRLGRCHPWGGFGPDPVPEVALPLHRASGAGGLNRASGAGGLEAAATSPPPPTRPRRPHL